MSSTRVYIGHLPYNAREGDVDNFFSRYGRIQEIFLRNGFGFVEFEDARDAEEAVYRCNGKELKGQRVIVEMTKRPPKGFRSGGGGGRYGGGYGGGGGGRGRYDRSPPRRRDDNPPVQTKYRLVVENLSSRISWQELKDIMRSAGDVTYADAHRIRRNEGIVCFARRSDLEKALDSLDGKEYNGRKIKLIDATRDSRHRSKSRSGSHSRSRSRSRTRRSRSGSASSKSSGTASRSKSKSGSHSRSVSVDKKNSKRKSKEKSASHSRSRSASVDDKHSVASGSRSPSPAANGHRKSDVEDD